MYIDLLLAILHHLLVFTLAAALAAEFVLLRPGLAGRDLNILAHIDGAYGGIAGAVVVVGVLRVFFGLRGWEFYAYNAFFWAKMAVFVVVGLLSIVPTIRIQRWKRAAAGSQGLHIVPERDVADARRYLRLEAALFVLIPIFAAMMVRVGY